MTLNFTLTLLARAAVQGAWGWAIAHFAVLNAIPANTAVDGIVTGVVIGGYAGLTVYLQTRKGDGFWQKAARGLGNVLMLGLVKTPSYPPPAPKPETVSEPATS